MNTDNIKYILYVRKSSESEDRQMASIEDQINEMTKLAKNLRLNIVETITESQSAKQPGRLGFNTMLKKIHNGEANGILCWKLNRLARNPIDGGQISWMLQQYKIHHIQTYNREYRPHDNVLMMQVEFGMANQFINDLRADVKRGMRNKAKRGWYPIGILPMGYIHNHSKENTHKEILCDPKTFPLIKKLWKMILTTNYTMKEIYEYATNEMGLRNKNGKPFDPSSLYRWFTHEFYCGYFHWRDENGVLTRFKGKHTPMVTEAEFGLVQQILGRRGRPVGTAKYDLPYRGLIFCGECGCTYTVDHKLQCICTKCRNKFSIKRRNDCPKCETSVEKMDSPTIVNRVYYRCTKKRGTCSQKQVELTKVESQIKKFLKFYTICDSMHEWGVEKLEDALKEDLNSKLLINKEAKKREEKLNKLAKNYLKMRANEEITEEEYAKLRKEVQEEISLNQSQMNQQFRSKENGLDSAKTILKFSNIVLERFENGSQKDRNLILSALGSNLKIKEKKLCFSMPKPLWVIKNCIESQESNLVGIEPEKVVVNKGDYG